MKNSHRTTKLNMAASSITCHHVLWQKKNTMQRIFPVDHENENLHPECEERRRVTMNTDDVSRQGNQDNRQVHIA